MGAGGVSESEVSRLVCEIDERVNAFLSRPIEGEWPYLWIDATYVKELQGGRIVSTAVIVAVGVNTDGRRKVLGVATGASEAEVFWKGFLRSLADWGLRGVKLVVPDDHKGLRAAAGKVFSATHQRCRVGLLKKSAFEASLGTEGRPSRCELGGAFYQTRWMGKAGSAWEGAEVLLGSQTMRTVLIRSVRAASD